MRLFAMSAYAAMKWQPDSDSTFCDWTYCSGREPQRTGGIPLEIPMIPSLHQYISLNSLIS